MLLEELGAEDGGSDTEQPTASKHPLWQVSENFWNSLHFNF
jgi:hypothetical protein